jgi:hypothetical protein
VAKDFDFSEKEIKEIKLQFNDQEYLDILEKIDQLVDF